MANKNRGISKRKNHKHKIVGDKELTDITKGIGILLIVLWSCAGFVFMIAGKINTTYLIGNVLSGPGIVRLFMFIFTGLIIITWLLSRLYPEVN